MRTSRSKHIAGKKQDQMLDAKHVNKILKKKELKRKMQMIDDMPANVSSDDFKQLVQRMKDKNRMSLFGDLDLFAADKGRSGIFTDLKHMKNAMMKKQDLNFYNHKAQGGKSSQ